jgi:hypothetical protein
MVIVLPGRPLALFKRFVRESVCGKQNSGQLRLSARSFDVERIVQGAVQRSQQLLNFFLGVVNPEYHSWIYDDDDSEAEDERRRNHGNQKPHESISPELSGGWEAFSDALALTLVRLPEDGVLTVVANSRHSIRFSYIENSRTGLHLKADLLGASEIVATTLRQDGWIKIKDRKGGWARWTKWPAPYDDYRVLADGAVFALRDCFAVHDPADTVIDSRSLSYEKNVDLTDFKDSHID